MKLMVFSFRAWGFTFCILLNALLFAAAKDIKTSNSNINALVIKEIPSSNLNDVNLTKTLQDISSPEDLTLSNAANSDSEKNRIIVPIIIKMVIRVLESKIENNDSEVADMVLKFMKNEIENVTSIKDLTNHFLKSNGISESDEEMRLYKSELTRAIADKLSNFIWKFLQKLFPVDRILERFQSRWFPSMDEAEYPKKEHKTLDRNLVSKFIMRSRDENKFKHVTSRQLSLYPPWYYNKDVYGHEIPPDEKITFHDALPRKMVKFIKGIVADAPWEHMFQKMVRMVVDQFVDRILEKMFALHAVKDKRRSLDTPKVFMPISRTSVIRLKRSSSKDTTSPKDDEMLFRDSDVFREQKSHAEKTERLDGKAHSENQLEKHDTFKSKDSSEENASWFDAILDYIFPDDPKDGPEGRKYRKKRDTASVTEREQLAKILKFFFLKYKKLNPEAASHYNFDCTKRKPRKNMLTILSNQPDQLLELQDLNVDFSKNEKTANRWKRSAAIKAYTDDERNRLWTPSRKERRLSDHKTSRGCSLRRACHTGRLLSKLPAVHDITLQLKSHEDEPHWDALLWGLRKKKCSKVFCKRQRLPKGSSMSWNE